MPRRKVERQAGGTSRDKQASLEAAVEAVAGGATGASVFRIAKAKADDPGLHKRLGRTASRSAYRTMSKMGLRWDIPISEVVFHTDVGLELNIPYIKPSDALTYILRNRPEVVLGGFTSLPAGADLLHGFWKIYREYHGSHRVFNDYGESLQYCLPFFYMVMKEEVVAGVTPQCLFWNHHLGWARQKQPKQRKEVALALAVLRSHPLKSFVLLTVVPSQ